MLSRVCLAVAVVVTGLMSFGGGWPEPEATVEPASQVAAGSNTLTPQSASTGDWPMWGRTPARNMVSPAARVSLDFEPPKIKRDARTPGRRVIWEAALGSQTYGQPIVSQGNIYIGTNNEAGYRPHHKGDRGCLLCFSEKTGEFRWQLTREKLPSGRVHDWPMQGIASVPCVVGDRLWVVTNRCELMCLDTHGFTDGENDGHYQTEVDATEKDADIVWSLDMMDEPGVFPHNLATSAPVVCGDLVYVITGNGVDEAHLEVPSPRSPCFIAVHKDTGKIVWEDNSPFDRILHGQWSCPSIGQVNGRAQVYMPGGDGWLYAFDARTGEKLWWFDMNPKDSVWELGGRGDRNSIIGTPVFLDGSVVLAVGQDPEHGDGVGHLYRIKVNGRGDVSARTPDGKLNPKSAQMWHYGGLDSDGSLTGEKDGYIFRRTLSTVAIAGGLVFAADTSGFLHCVDFHTGRRYWEHDTFAGIWGSPLVVGGHVLIGTDDGDLIILKARREKKVIANKLFPSSVYSTPAFANGRIYIADRSRLFAFGAD